MATWVQRNSGGEVAVRRRYRRSGPAAGQGVVQQHEVGGVQVGTREHDGLHTLHALHECECAPRCSPTRGYLFGLRKHAPALITMTFSAACRFVYGGLDRLPDAYWAAETFPADVRVPPRTRQRTSGVIAGGRGGAWSSHHSCAVSTLSCRAAASAPAALVQQERRGITTLPQTPRIAFYLTL